MDKRIPNSEIRRAWLDESLSTTEAARQVGLTRTNLWLRAKALGLAPRKPGRRNRINRTSDFAEMWLAGVLCEDIAAHLGCHPLSVSRLAAEAGLPKRLLGYRPRVTIADFRRSKEVTAMMATAAAENAALRGLRE